MYFKNLVLANFFNCLQNFHLFFFAENLVENREEVCSCWNISSIEDSYDEPSSISESSDESLSLSPSDSSDDELYFLLLEPLGFLLGESCLFSGYIYFPSWYC